MPYVIFSVITGSAAWEVAGWNLGAGKGNRLGMVLSFGACLLSIWAQILLLNGYGDTWVPVVDGMDALTTAVPVLAGGTLLGNLAAAIRWKK